MTSSAVPTAASSGGEAGMSTGGRAPTRRSRTAGRSLRYLGRRFGFYLFTFWAALTFIIPRFMPGDPAATMVRRIQQLTGQAPTPEQIRSVNSSKWTGWPDPASAEYVPHTLLGPDTILTIQNLTPAK